VLRGGPNVPGVPSAESPAAAVEFVRAALGDER
jgi:hypothetical protein